jgi:hypothetical protein
MDGENNLQAWREAVNILNILYRVADSDGPPAGRMDGRIHDVVKDQNFTDCYREPMTRYNLVITVMRLWVLQKGDKSLTKRLSASRGLYSMELVTYSKE